MKQMYIDEKGREYVRTSVLPSALKVGNLILRDGDIHRIKNIKFHRKSDGIWEALTHPRYEIRLESGESMRVYRYASLTKLTPVIK